MKITDDSDSEIDADSDWPNRPYVIVSFKDGVDNLGTDEHLSVMVYQFRTHIITEEKLVNAQIWVNRLGLSWLWECSIISSFIFQL